MEWLIISLAILGVLIIGAVGFIIDKGRKVKRLEDKPQTTPRIDKQPERSSPAGTTTKEPPADAAPSTTRPSTGQPESPSDASGTTTAATTDVPASPTAPATPTTPTDGPPSDRGASDLDTVPEVVIPDSPAELAPETEAPAEPAVELDSPPSTKGRMGRLRDRLARSNSAFGRGLLAVISKDEMEEDDWEDLEDSLLQADVGVAAATHIVEQLRTKSMVEGARSASAIKQLLADELIEALRPDFDRSLSTSAGTDGPAVVMVVGVNGTGKTTTCGKLARVLVGDGNTVLMGAADTFRAAAADQLATWGERVGVDVVRGPEKADPASVAFDAVKAGKERGVDTVLIDTAGRLHTKTGLMDELGKVKRVIEKQGPVDETLLVLDATTGQNGLVQARVFTDVVDVTGVVLTKLDGSAKGGIVIAVQNELGVPVKYVGIGEGKDDLAPFVPEEFVEGLLGSGSK